MKATQLAVGLGHFRRVSANEDFIIFEFGIGDLFNLKYFRWPISILGYGSYMGRMALWSFRERTRKDCHG